jgi:hypothetical protein
LSLKTLDLTVKVHHSKRIQAQFLSATLAFANSIFSIVTFQLVTKYAFLFEIQFFCVKSGLPFTQIKEISLFMVML